MLSLQYLPYDWLTCSCHVSTYKSYIQVVHTSHTYKSYIQVIHTSKSYIQVIHTSHTYKSYIQVVHTSHTYKSYIQVIHTSHTYKSYIQVIHTIHTYKSSLARATKSFLRTVRDTIQIWKILTSDPNPNEIYDIFLAQLTV